MAFSILHISDLHRDLSDELGNAVLLNSLEHDVARFQQNEPPISRPSLCIVSGDIVYGVRHDDPKATDELARQYVQAEEFLVGLADRLFQGDRERVVIIPGNHDVCYSTVMQSMSRIDLPAELVQRQKLVGELFKPHSLLRWSWAELCFFRITDQALYNNRLKGFADLYERFYQGRRNYRLAPEEQYDLFDFNELGLTVVALNSCYQNDPMHRSGAFHPEALSKALRHIREAKRTGWLVAATWHHSLRGTPTEADYLDSEVFQMLIDHGVSLGFHGHQHLAEYVEERYRLGVDRRSMAIISASTLCAGHKNLKPGVPRSYNIVGVNPGTMSGMVHQRKMQNGDFALPIWGPGHFNLTNASYIPFELCTPMQVRPEGLNTQLLVEQAHTHAGKGEWKDVIDTLAPIATEPNARPLLSFALQNFNDPSTTITVLWPPATIGEAVVFGDAVLQLQNGDEAKRFLSLALVNDSTDSSILELTRRIKLKLGT